MKDKEERKQKDEIEMKSKSLESALSELHTAQPELSLIVRHTGEQLTLTVRDNGIGMESTIINKIFDPFFTTKTTGEASGVGLYLTREIIQNHGGDIQVKSKKDEYSEFTITLPTLKQ